MSSLHFDAGVYIWKGRHTEREQPAKAGFKWSRLGKRWQTKDVKVAAKLLEEAEMADALRVQITDAMTAKRRAVAASYAQDSVGSFPAPKDLEYRPFQKAGISFAVERENVLIGDEMGLGKTIQAIGAMNALPEVKKVLIIAPKSLLVNWQRELQAWLIRGYTIGVATGKEWPCADIVILNYDILIKHPEELHTPVWDMLICDECHYLKNESAKRTKMVMGDPRGTAPPILAHRKLMLSGTPMPNRPIELWAILHYLDGHTFRSFRSFAFRYCGAYDSEWGLETGGASHLDELRDMLRETVMIRRRKVDVLDDLPAKIRQVVELPFKLTRALKAGLKREAGIKQKVNDFVGDFDVLTAASAKEYTQQVRGLKAKLKIIFEEVAALRHETALEKVPVVLEYLKVVLESDDKIVVFAHHRNMISKLEDALENLGIGVVTVTGATKDRQAEVDKFQTDPAIQVFLGNIKAAGEGLNLTAASHVIFAEPDWTCGSVSQAEDRCHRIGTKHPVLVQHLVLEDSLDVIMAKRLIRKQGIIDRVLDEDVDAVPETQVQSVLSLLTGDKFAEDVKQTLSGKPRRKGRKGMSDEEWRLVAWR